MIDEVLKQTEVHFTKISEEKLNLREIKFIINEMKKIP